MTDDDSLLYGSAVGAIFVEWIIVVIAIIAFIYRG